MFKTIRHWVKNLRWLLNRPPTSFTFGREMFPCDYCGDRGAIEIIEDGVWLRFCWGCIKKALDKALKPKTKRSKE